MNQVKNELLHSGVLGMKWGKRSARGAAGPGVGIGAKRQSAINKSDRKTLDNGGHLSVGLTKKRQESLDQRDRKVLDKRDAKIAPKQSSTEKRIIIGASVVAGLLASNFGGVAVYKLTGNLDAAKMVAPALGVIGGMKYYEWVSKPANPNIKDQQGSNNE